MKIIVTANLCLSPLTDSLASREAAYYAKLADLRLRLSVKQEQLPTLPSRAGP